MEDSQKLFRPTLQILDRQTNPCDICKRNHMQEYLCRHCTAQLCKVLQTKAPGPVYQHGAHIYCPIPAEVTTEIALKSLQFAFGFYHMGFDFAVTSLGPMNLEAQGVVNVPGQVIVMRPYRLFDNLHFLFRNPNILWSIAISEKGIQEPRVKT